MVNKLCSKISLLIIGIRLKWSLLILRSALPILRLFLFLSLRLLISFLSFLLLHLQILDLLIQLVCFVLPLFLILSMLDLFELHLHLQTIYPLDFLFKTILSILLLLLQLLPLIFKFFFFFLKLASLLKNLCGLFINSLLHLGDGFTFHLSLLL